MSLAELEKLIKLDSKEALGCTEPISIALATCKASRLLESDISKIHLKLSTNLLKNALEVGIPGTRGETGIPIAAALGCVITTSEPDLQLLKGINEQLLDKARKIVAEDRITLELSPGKHGLFVDAEVTDNQNNLGRAIIQDNHENLVLLEKNGKIIFSSDKTDTKKTDLVQQQRQIVASTPFAHFWNNIEQLSDETRAHLLKGIDINTRVAEAGLNSDMGLKIGSLYNKLITEGWLGDDVVNRAKAFTSAAVDARMSGCELSVMTSGGAGNQGLTVTLPLKVLAEHLKADNRKLTEALAISHAITSILKHHTGTLSAMCGCVVCSGTGLTAGITYLLGGSLAEATAAVNNMVGSVTGIICDGAKVGCSIKLICAVDAAFQAAMMAKNGLNLPLSNGVIGETLESSLANIGLIAAPGMIKTDDQILAIMLGKTTCGQ